MWQIQLIPRKPHKFYYFLLCNESVTFQCLSSVVLWHYVLYWLLQLCPLLGNRTPTRLMRARVYTAYNHGSCLAEHTSKRVTSPCVFYERITPVSSLYTIALLLTCMSRRAQSGTRTCFGRRVWFIELHTVLVIFFFTY